MPDHHSPAASPEQLLRETFLAQQQAYQAAPYPSAAARQQKLRAVLRQMQRYQDRLAEAMSQDFGHRAHAESKMMDLLGASMELRHSIAHLKRWMRSSCRRPELLFFSNRLQVQYQPKGVVGIIVPWNFPVYLALGPLSAALAAGNRVMIKMSEVTPATNHCLRQMLAECFAVDEVAVFGEEITDPQAFTRLPFNHLIFTGSPAIGKLVMQAAAANLTPVTLELGGKSPALVLRDYDINDAALRITHGKATNCGQICVSPDYALVPRESLDAFVGAVRATFTQFYGQHTAGNNDYCSVVNDRHFARINALLDDARQKGATVIACAEVHAGSRQLPLHLVLDTTPEMRLMQEEIFGPILPILPYDDLADALQQVHQRERPLALYCFSHDAAARQQLLHDTHSGGVSINDWGWHVVNHDAPFGGIGHSGMGNYHGEEGFRELSHAKTVFRRQRFFPTQLFYPPYGTWLQKMTLKFFLGQADPTLVSKTGAN